VLMTSSIRHIHGGHLKAKVVSSVLLVSLSFYVGCYTTEPVTKQELIAQGEKVDIAVYTHTSLRYDFPGGYYRVRGDTLSGIVPVRRDLFSEARYDSGRPIDILFSDIKSIDTETFDVVTTILIVGGVALAGLIAVAIVFGGSH
jgi:hypothetical protein